MSSILGVARRSVRLAGAAALLLLALVRPASAELKTFTLDAPDAKAVYLAGEMTDWDAGKKAMARDKNGRWSISVDLGPGQWLYKFVVDGKWITDPSTADNDNDGQGGRHSFVFVGKGPWNERTDIAHGEVRTHSVESKSWGKAMKTHVYLPPAYEKGRAYPVLLLLHGSGMDADQWLKTGHIERYLDNLLADGKIKPFVVVMPSSEDINYTGKSERFITEELPAWLQANYGLKPGPKRYAVAGMSMGGFGAFHLPLRHPQQFGFGFALSGFYPSSYLNTLPAEPKLPFRFMALCGSEDSLVGSNRSLARLLQKRGADFYYRENKGAHTFQYWSLHTAEMLSAVDNYFSGGAVPQNAAQLDLGEEEVATGLPPTIEGKEIPFTPDLLARLRGIWRGEWAVMPGASIKGGYEETVTAAAADHYEGMFSVANAGPDSKFDEPFNVPARVEKGRLHFVNPADGSDVITVLSEKDGRLWRQWMIKANGLDILVRVQKVADQ